MEAPLFAASCSSSVRYEGYNEVTELNLNGVVPNQITRDRLLAALRFPETRIVLDTMPMPTEDIVSSSGVVNADYGRYRGIGTRKRTENHVVFKTDLSVRNAVLSTTYTRMRPWTIPPRINVNNSNDRIFPNEQDRIASLLTNAFRQWTTETRFGFNRLHVERYDTFLDFKKPGFTGPDELYDVRVPSIQISGGFTTPQSEIYISHGGTYSFEQKLTRSAQGHLMKTGFRFMRETGNKQTPENPRFIYQNLNDTLADIAQSVAVDFSSPPYHSALDQYSAFIQDDWRVFSDLTLNLGLRYDYYSVIKVRPASNIPVEFVNMGPLTDIHKLDFNGFRDPSRPYEPDHAFAPRLGFAWKVGGRDATVVRGGVGKLVSSHSTGTIRQTIADPTAPFRFIFNRVESIQKNLKWPLYTEDFRDVVNTAAQGSKTVFSVFDPDIRVPYTLQSMLSVQQGIGSTMAVEVGFQHTEGRRFPLHRFFALAIDRATGARPNPALGAPGGYYITDEQTMVYNALQTQLRKRFSNNYSLNVNYTLAKAEATQGGDLSAYFGGSDITMTQDFWDPEADRGPTNDDIRHRVNVMGIYHLPLVNGGSGLLNAIAGNWQVTGILNARTGSPLIVSQPSGIPNSRPDAVPGVDPGPVGLEGNVQRHHGLQLLEPGCLRPCSSVPDYYRRRSPRYLRVVLGSWQVGIGHDVCQELRPARVEESTGESGVLQRTEQDAVVEPQHEHELTRLWPNHRRWGKSYGSVWPKADVLDRALGWHCQVGEDGPSTIQGRSRFSTPVDELPARGDAPHEGDFEQVLAPTRIVEHARRI